MAAFQDVWQSIRARLSVGAEVPNWSIEGYTGNSARIDGVNYDEVIVSGDRTTTPRHVPRREFEKIFDLWDRYKQGAVSRDEIQKVSHNSTYVFSILHWLEESVDE